MAKSKFATLKQIMGRDKYEVIMRAIKKVKEKEQQPNMSDSRALELISLNYLSGN